MDETAELLERIDDRAWLALPLDLRWKIIPWAIDAGALSEAERLLDALERERGESVKLLELRVRLATARNDDADLGRLLRLRAERYPSATASVQLARWLLKQGDAERAAELCDSVRVDHSSQIQVQHLRNAVDLARGQGDAVRRRLQRDLTADPDGFWPNAFMAEWLLDHDDSAAARPLLHRIVVDTVERGYDSPMLRLAALLDRAGEPGLAADLRTKAETIRGERHAELARRIDAALASLPASTGDPDLDDAIDRFSASQRSDVPSVDSPGPGSARTVDEPADEPVTPMSGNPTVEMPLDPRVFDVLQRDFGHTDLRDGQRQVIARVMSGVDTLAIMPTGAGKSLTFQLPAMLLPGVTIVISPLIALMKDQLESLPPRVRERSTIVNSTLTFDEVQDRMDDIRAGKIRLVYIAPERFRDHRFLRTLQGITISLAVIDEAHCIDLWGADFRPDYLFIPKALAELGDPPVLAVTATATPRMANDIATGLGRELEIVRVSLFRPNLFYAVEEVRNREQKVTRLVELCRQLQGAGIVYVGSRKDAESLAATLGDRGVQAIPYHAGLAPDIRAANQERFMSGRARVVVATVAFGMGIDKADVRFIIHFSAPASLEAYAQESGRAGRDGRGARCILLATPNDGTRLRQFARRNRIRIESLRSVYAEIKRAASGDWTVIDSHRLELALNDPDDDDSVDVRVALGILEQAGLITRHPDAPVHYAVSRFGDSSPADDRSTVPARVRAWLDTRSFPSTIETAATCSALDISPFELDRYLSDAPNLAVRSGTRGIAIHLLPPPPNIAQRIEGLLARAQRDDDRRIDTMMAYIQDRQGVCRHVILAAHFGERLQPCRDSCDVCTSTVAPSTARQPRDRSSRATLADAMLVLQAAQELPYPMGKPSLIKLLTGSTESRVRDDRSAHFGAARHLTPHALDRLIDALVDHDYLAFYMRDDYRLLEVTAKGRNARSVELPDSRIERRSRLAEAVPDIDPDSDTGRRYARLADWRRKQKDLEDKSAFVIASNAQLRAMAADPPATIDDLAKISGFGAKRAQRYGADILRILAGD